MVYVYIIYYEYLKTLSSSPSHNDFIPEGGAVSSGIAPLGSDNNDSAYIPDSGKKTGWRICFCIKGTYLLWLVVVG